MRLDVVWRDLIENLNESGAPLLLKAPIAVARSGYGWCEFIESSDCVSRSQFSDYFEQAGAWLSLFGAFAGTDMHEENIIASGCRPVPVDLEMLLQASDVGTREIPPEMRAFEVASRQISESVLMTGLLPVYGRTPEKLIFGHGGLDNQPQIRAEPYWIDINTDSMQPGKRSRLPKPGHNLPRVGSTVGKLGDYVDSVISGFQSYANFLAHHSKFFDILKIFENLFVRTIRRPTNY